MYTEEDLRATLGALESEAPDAVGVLAALARARRRQTVRRRVVGVVAAAVVVAVVAGGSVLVGNLADPSGRDAAAQQAEELARLRYPFAVAESPGFRVSYGPSRFHGAYTAWVGPTVAGSGVPYPYLLEVHEADRYTPSTDQADEPVQVNGLTGFYRRYFRYGFDKEDLKGVPAVAWSYAPGAWAVVRYQPLTPEAVPPSDVQEALLRVATAVRFDQTTPVRLPFQIGYLPAGFHPAEEFPANMSDYGPHRTVARIILVGDRAKLEILLFQIVDASDPPGSVIVDETWEPGHRVMVRAGEHLDGVVLGEGISLEEMKKIARSISPASNVDDEDTWFDADKALPLR